MAINETVLEMHYHKPLMDFFREAIGLGKRGVNFYKYSPQKEVFVGFDQAYAMTELSDDAFFEMLKESSTKADYKLPKKFLAVFLQFKVVKAMSNIQKITPPGITNKPHYRSKLDTAKNQNTGFSQHELLFKLNKNDGAMVFYACPMIFDKSLLYEVNVNLDKLVLVDVDSSPSQYSDNETHYIFFNDQEEPPVWCSDPVQGKRISVKELAEQMVNVLDDLDTTESSARVLKQLTHIRNLVESEQMGAPFGNELKERPFSIVHDSLMIIEVVENRV